MVRLESQGAVVQLASVNNELRYIAVSKGADGKIDYEMFIPQPPADDKGDMG
jgi:hypothetical protein